MAEPTTTLTWIQVADDAIKIGLGALIGGVFTWIVARNNNRSALKKLLFERKAQILSDVAKIHEEHFQAYYKYSLNLCVVAEEKSKKMSNERAQAIHSALLENYLSEATRLRLQMAQKIPETIYVQSQLMLLGEDAAVKKSQYLVKVIGDADQSFKFNGSDTFDVSNFEKDAKIIGQAREAFFRELQRAYHKE
ncbi:MAG: hypothetical protein WAO02_16550 [Verrucomicrobiia bacterium]